MAAMKPGTRLKSAVCATEVMVVAAPEAIEVTCGGAPLVGLGEAGGGTLSPDAKGGTQIGKRYVNAAGNLELLCIKPGEGTLAVGGVPLQIKGAKPLPASD
jgi:hypothetical protein